MVAKNKLRNPASVALANQGLGREKKPPVNREPTFLPFFCILKLYTISKASGFDTSITNTPRTDRRTLAASLFNIVVWKTA